MPASAPDRVPTAMVTVLAWPTFLSAKLPLADTPRASPATRPLNSAEAVDTLAAVVAS